VSVGRPRGAYLRAAGVAVREPRQVVLSGKTGHSQWGVHRLRIAKTGQCGGDAPTPAAVLAVFLRMDEGTCLRLLSAYEGTAVAEFPPRFRYDRRLVAAFAGTMSLHVARLVKHPGATGAETLEATLALGDFYQQMRAGVLTLGTPEGQWAFGLALLKECLTL
jgi:hypothetical protein